jgi:hypothetical protein
MYFGQIGPLLKVTTPIDHEEEKINLHRKNKFTVLLAISRLQIG